MGAAMTILHGRTSTNPGRIFKNDTLMSEPLVTMRRDRPHYSPPPCFAFWRYLDHFNIMIQYIFPL
ncbi:hypothetical protein BD779DRAFT_1545300, partial [Infundibulicybe gibba]